MSTCYVSWFLLRVVSLRVEKFSSLKNPWKCLSGEKFLVHLTYSFFFSSAGTRRVMLLVYVAAAGRV